MIQSLKTPARYERSVAEYLNTFDGVKAERPTVGSKYPDVFVEYKGKTSWIEVKMNEEDQLGTPRVMFNGERWVSKDSPVQNFTCDVLNSSEQATQFVKDLKSLGSVIPTTKGGLKDPAAVPVEAMTEFLSDRKQYVCEIDNVDLGDLVAKHYNFGKTEPAHYIQTGDQFFSLGENPFNLPLPSLSGKGIFKVRIGVRTDFYEVLPEIKIRGELYSPYSVAHGTLKPHPF